MTTPRKPLKEKVLSVRVAPDVLTALERQGKPSKLAREILTSWLTRRGLLLKDGSLPPESPTQPGA